MLGGNGALSLEGCAFQLHGREGKGHEVELLAYQLVDNVATASEKAGRLSIMKHLLIVAHAPSPNTFKLRQAAERGARHADVEGVEICVKPPLDAGPEDVLACDAILLGTTENLGYMSGALKDFFDRSYYPLL
jgi:hypothetical protein